MIDPARRPPPRNTNAGGFLVAAALLVGTVVGVMVGEPTIGFLAGLGIGAASATALWLLDRR